MNTKKANKLRNQEAHTRGLETDSTMAPEDSYTHTRGLETDSTMISESMQVWPQVQRRRPPEPTPPMSGHDLCFDVMRQLADMGETLEPLHAFNPRTMTHDKVTGVLVSDGCLLFQFEETD